MISEVRISDRSPLACFFSPASVALIGATDREGSVGRSIVNNLLVGTYKGKVYAVNPHRAELCGRRCYPSIAAVPEAIDLVVIVTPAPTVPGIVAGCVKAKAKAVVVISAGFKEKGPEGAALEQQIQSELKRGATRLVGPNCLGVMKIDAATFGVNNLPGMFGTAGVSSMKISTSAQTVFENVSSLTALSVGDAVSIRGPMFMASGTPTLIASKVQKR